MESTLKKEHDFYNAHKKEFIEKYLGKEVLIYQGKLQGVFDDCTAALKFAIAHNFESEKFIIHTVSKDERKLFIAPLVMECGL